MSFTFAMWWKIYFWFIVIVFSGGTLLLFQDKQTHIPALILDSLISFFAVVGLYAYTFRKKIYTVQFWKIFFWGNLLWQVLGLLYAVAPDAPGIQYLSAISVTGEQYSAIDVLFSYGLTLPMLYATYELSKGNSRENVEKLKKGAGKKVHSFEWGIVQIALWGYSTIFTLLIVIFSFFPSNTGDTAPTDVVSGLAGFAPLVVFWILVLTQYKEYHWNWWKVTLVANTFLYMGFILLGLFSQPSGTASGGIDLIGTFGILIIFLSLVVFGREKLNKPHLVPKVSSD